MDLRAVDGLTLSVELRAVLRPGEMAVDQPGTLHRLPRFFFEVESWTAAHEVRLTSHFRLWELMLVDCRETDLLLRKFPHYVPCAITVLAHLLETFRAEVGVPVFVSANGGYRSPAHRFSMAESMHQWGTAADIYRVGDTYLDNEKTIDRYARIVSSLGGDVVVRPYAAGDDHLHLDLGFVSVTPRKFSEE